MNHCALPPLEFTSLATSLVRNKFIKIVLIKLSLMFLYQIHSRKSKCRKHILKSIDLKHKIPDQRQIYKTKTLVTAMITKANSVYKCTVGVSI